MSFLETIIERAKKDTHNAFEYICEKEAINAVIKNIAIDKEVAKEVAEDTSSPLKIQLEEDDDIYVGGNLHKYIGVEETKK